MLPSPGGTQLSWPRHPAAGWKGAAVKAQGGCGLGWGVPAWSQVVVDPFLPAAHSQRPSVTSQLGCDYGAGLVKVPHTCAVTAPRSPSLPATAPTP